MKKDIIQKIETQNSELKQLSKCLENISIIINNTENSEILNDLKKSLKKLTPILQNFEQNINELEISLSDENLF